MEDKRPMYKVEVDLNNSVMDVISFVEAGAIEVDFVALSKQPQEKLVQLSEDKRIIISPILIPDKPIYRNDDGYEYDMYFDREAITKLQYLFMKDKNINKANLDHDPKEKVDGVVLLEIWMKESENDKSKDYELFKDLPQGTLFVKEKIDNDELWKDIKNKTYKKKKLKC